MLAFQLSPIWKARPWRTGKGCIKAIECPCCCMAYVICNGKDKPKPKGKHFYAHATKKLCKLRKAKHRTYKEQKAAQKHWTDLV
jgi:hypothetical protein